MHIFSLMQCSSIREHDCDISTKKVKIYTAKTVALSFPTLSYGLAVTDTGTVQLAFMTALFKTVTLEKQLYSFHLTNCLIIWL